MKVSNLAVEKYQRAKLLEISIDSNKVLNFRYTLARFVENYIPCLQFLNT